MARNMTAAPSPSMKPSRAKNAEAAVAAAVVDTEEEAEAVGVTAVEEAAGAVAAAEAGAAVADDATAIESPSQFRTEKTTKFTKGARRTTKNTRDRTLKIEDGDARSIRTPPSNSSFVALSAPFVSLVVIRSFNSSFGFPHLFGCSPPALRGFGFRNLRSLTPHPFSPPRPITG